MLLRLLQHFDLPERTFMLVFFFISYLKPVYYLFYLIRYKTNGLKIHYIMFFGNFRNRVTFCHNWMSEKLYPPLLLIHILVDIITHILVILHLFANMQFTCNHLCFTITEKGHMIVPDCICIVTRGGIYDEI